MQAALADDAFDRIVLVVPDDEHWREHDLAARLSAASSVPLSELRLGPDGHFVRVHREFSGGS